MCLDHCVLGWNRHKASEKTVISLKPPVLFRQETQAATICPHSPPSLLPLSLSEVSTVRLT